MEHIVQFAIGIDEERIVDAVEKNAEKKITKDIEQAVIDKLFESHGWSKATVNDGFSAYAASLINDFLESYKGDIIDKAAEHLAKKLSRTKAAKTIFEKED